MKQRDTTVRTELVFSRLFPVYGVLLIHVQNVTV